jgi:hypothetical protein
MSQVVGMLSFIKDTMWKTMFGKQADSLERVTEKDDECENFPHPQLPKRLSMQRLIPYPFA